MTIMRGIYSTQAKGTMVCLHVGETALLVGRRRGDCWLRVEIGTHFHRFRATWLPLRRMQRATI